MSLSPGLVSAATHTMSHPRASSLPEVLAILRLQGAAPSRHAPMSQREHALQCASLAQRSGASSAVVTACLLHDIGQLLDAQAPSVGAPDAEAASIDRCEEAGAAWLADLMPLSVVQPVRWHAQAKRYLAATAPAWLPGLSMQARREIERRGGPMTPEACRQFEQRPFAAEAVAVATFDELACARPGPVLAVEWLARPLEACARRA